MSAIRLPCALPLAGVARPQAQEMERLALAVRDQTLELYRHFLHGKPIVDATRWKSVKQKEGVEVFVGRERHPPTAFHAGLSPGIASPELLADADFVPQIQLRLVGQTLGTLDDAMLGAAAPTELSMVKRAAAISDDSVDHRTLLALRTPTADAPFTYSALKWSLHHHHHKPRDWTYIEAAGFTSVVCNGKTHRVGFVVHHSMRLPQLPSLDTQGVTRAKVSRCTLFRQLAPGAVEVFATEAVSPGGDLPYKTTTTQAADALLLQVAKTTEHALKKKLVWMQTARTHGTAHSALAAFASPVRRSSHDSFAGIRSSRTSKCENCMRALSALRSFTNCDVCQTYVCSRCMTNQKLVYGERRHSIRVTPVAVCKGCLSTAKHLNNAQDLAVHEFVEHATHGRVASTRSNTSRRPSYASTELSSSCDYYEPSPVAESVRSVRSVCSMKSSSRRPSCASTSSSVSYDDHRSPVGCYDRESSTSSRIDEGEDASPPSALVAVRYNRTQSADAAYCSRPLPTPPPSSSSARRQQQQQLHLWQQMNELCMQAESTYRQTKQQAQDHAVRDRFYSER